MVRNAYFQDQWEDLMGEMLGHLQSTAEVPLGKALTPQMLTQGPVMSWRLIQDRTLPSPNMQLRQTPAPSRWTRKG